MKTAQLQQPARQLRLEAEPKERLAIVSMEAAANSASNNIMIAGLGGGYRIDQYHVARPSGVVSVSSIDLFGLSASRCNVHAMIDMRNSFTA